MRIVHRRKAGQMIQERIYAEDSPIEVERRHVPRITIGSIDRECHGDLITLKRVRLQDLPMEPEPERMFAPATQFSVRDHNLAMLQAVGARWHKAGRFQDPRKALA